MGPTLVVDGMILAYRVNHSLGWMKTSKGEPTGLRFGFLKSVMSYQKQLQAEGVIIAWDMKGAIIKADATPEYKANRVRTEGVNEMFGQLDELRNMLQKTRWSQMWLEGYEADDLIAAYVQSFPDKYTVILTSDNDMHQLVTAKVNVWPGDKREHMTRQGVKDKWGVWPEQLALLRSVMGDQSDNLRPLLYGDTRTKFKEMLEANSNIHTAAEAFPAWQKVDGVEIMSESFWADLKKRERLMRPNTPESLEIYTGQRDQEYLLHLFSKMESKSLPGRLTEMV